MATKTFNIYYQNVRGLRTKCNSFFAQVAQSDYDIICITESWLTSDFFDNELFDRRYSVFRCDRSATESGSQRGGGVAVAVRADLRPLRRDWPVPSSSYSECVWLSIPLNNHDNKHMSVPSCSSTQRFINLACVYIPQGPGHKDTLTSFLDISSEIVNNHPDDTFLLVGDFNVPDIKWETYYSLDANFIPISSYGAQCLFDFLSFTGMKQCNSQVNYLNRVLDLVLCSSICNVTACDDPLTPEDQHHKSLVIGLDLNYMPPLKQKDVYTFNFHAANFEAISNNLFSINWCSYFSGMNMEDGLIKFYNLLNDLIIANVPRRKQRFSSSSPSWHSHALKKVLNEKRKYHKLWKLYNNRLDYESFIILRKRAKKMEAECYKKFIDLTEKNIKFHPKSFWSYVKAIFSNTRYPQTMYFKDIETSDGDQICNLFNDHFHSVFEPSEGLVDVELLDPPIDPVIDFHSVDISITLVKKYLNSVNIHKGAGPDGISPILIKKCSSALAEPIAILYKKSLSEGYMPASWKHAWVTPVPKGSVSRDIEKYRPISKLCQFGKIFEKIITDQLSVVVRPHIINSQHGFFRGRSVDTNLLTFTEDILNAMDDGNSVDAIYTDFAKAFDKICHKTLLLKLWHIGVHGDLFRWIRSYVERRSQSVVLGGYISQNMYISSGVPQGSHLGPLLFILYINDILKIFTHSNVLIYADDTKIYRVIREAMDCHLLQEDLKNFELYCKNNKLKLNIDKCYIISFTKKKNPLFYNYTLLGKPLTRVTQVRDLGVILDSKLSFIPHIESVLNKSYKNLGFILRISKPFRQSLTYKILYNSYVRSNLEFACSIWNPHFNNHINRLERVQKKFVKALEFRTGNTYISYYNSLKRHNVQSLVDRRNCVDSVLLCKLLQGHLDVPLLLSKIYFRVPRRRERACKKRDLFYITRCKTAYANNTFTRRACRLFNDNIKLKDFDLFSDKLYKLKGVFKHKV